MNHLPNTSWAWAGVAADMISDSQKNTVILADTFGDKYPLIVARLENILRDFEIPVFTLQGTKDLWIRDYAPIQTADPDVPYVQFKYSPDYLRGRYKKLITPPEVFHQLPFLQSISTDDLILDGGNVVGNSQYALLTRKLLVENRKVPEAVCERILKTLLWVERIVFLPWEREDVIGHSDGLVRFVTDSQVLINDYSQDNWSYGKKLSLTLEQNEIEVVATLPYAPTGKVTDGVESAVGIYLNYLELDRVIVFPQFELPQDDEALAIVCGLFPHKPVIPLECSSLADEGGVLNCTTWTVRL